MVSREQQQPASWSFPIKIGLQINLTGAKAQLVTKYPVDLIDLSPRWYIGNRSTGYFVTNCAFAPVRLTYEYDDRAAAAAALRRPTRKRKNCP